MPRPAPEKITFSVRVPLELDSTFRVVPAAKRLRLNEAISEAVVLFIEANRPALATYGELTSPAGPPVA